MVTVDELSLGRSLPAPIEVEVTDVNWNPGRSRRAEVELTDTAGNPLRLIDYEGANISLNWKQNHRYRISRCSIQKGGDGFEIDLAPSKKTQIEPLGPANSTTRLLVVGDTHVGRTTHPRTGAKISPHDAFRKAITYGFDRDVAAVVHVGDIFHESATSSQAEYVDTHVFTPLATAKTPFYYIGGNHTSKSGDRVLKRRAGDLVATLDTDGTSVNSQVRLFGISHHDNGNIPRSKLTFPNSVPEPVSILFLHQTVEQLSGRGPKAVDLERIQRHFGGQFDCIVAGHHHDAYCKDWNGTPVMYTGATEHMSKNDSPADRVAWLFTIDQGSVECERYDIP